jgi:hypothetical protein
MTTLMTVLNGVKSRLSINNTAEDDRIYDEIRTVIGQLNGKPYWFLRKTGTVAISAGVSSVAAPADFNILEGAELVYNGRRYFKGEFDIIEFEDLRRIYWRTDPIPNAVKPDAAALVNTTFHLSCTTTAESTLYLDYYRKDTALPVNTTDTSVFFADEARDVVIAAAQALFEARAMGDKAADTNIVNGFIAKLDREHERRVS